jgi:hypothetical protein
MCVTRSGPYLEDDLYAVYIALIWTQNNQSVSLVVCGAYLHANGVAGSTLDDVQF